MSSGSHVRPSHRQGNLKTEQLTAFKPFTPPDLRAAYSFARGVARMQPDALAARPGHRLVWVYEGKRYVSGTAFGSNTLLSQAEAFAIVGRHTQCGVVLGDDPFVALRHLLVRSIALPSGGVAVRILDLHTDAGFMLSDGSRQTSIFAEGPVAIAVGHYALVALPGETRDDELPDDLPATEVDTPQAVREQIAAMERALSPYRVNARPNGASRITLMPRLVMIGEPLPPRLGRLASGGKWGITLEREGRSATLAVSEEDLAGGVLIGRSEKCHSEMLRRITDNNTSRVHVLILRDGEQIHAYDLASTQGVYSEGLPARRVVLGDRGTLISLGRGDKAVKLYWHRIAV